MSLYDLSFSAQTPNSAATASYNPAAAASSGTAGQSGSRANPLQPTTNQPSASPAAPNPQPQGTFNMGKGALKYGRPQPGSNASLMRRSGRWGIPLWGLLFLLGVAIVATIWSIFSFMRRRRRED